MFKRKTRTGERKRRNKDQNDALRRQLAAEMSEFTNNHLRQEIVIGQEHNILKEGENSVVTTRYAALQFLFRRLKKSLNETNKKFEMEVKPFLDQIENIDNDTYEREASAFRFDSYSEQLLVSFVNLLGI